MAKINEEYRVDTILLALEESEAGDILSKLISSDEARQNLKYYIREENAGFIGEVILKHDNEKIEKYISGLVSIYPLSANILCYVMGKINLEELDVLQLFDISETFKRSFNKFKTVFNKNEIYDKNISDLDISIDRLEKKKGELSDKIAQLQSRKTNYSDLINEVNSLEAECKHLEADCSEEALKKKKEEYEAEIAKYKKNKKEADEELADLEKQLNSVKNSGNNGSFISAMYKFREVMQTMPKDEADIS